MRARALIVALVGGVAGAALLWLGIATSMQPNEGTPQGLTVRDHDFLMVGLAPFIALAAAFVCACIRPMRAPRTRARAAG